MHKLMKSSIAPYPKSLDEPAAIFGRMVVSYSGEMQAWHDHHLKVEALKETPMRDRPHPNNFSHIKDSDKRGQAFWEDTASWDRQKLERHEPYPPPAAHPDVMASVSSSVDAAGNITFIPDFVIINDDPSPDEIMALKKRALIDAIIQAEMIARAKIELPIGKQRAASIREIDLRNADLDLQKKIIIGKNADDILKINMELELRKLRNPVDQKFLDDQQDRSSKIDAIVRAGAKAMSDVEDLTIDNVDTFVVPSFDK